MRRILDINVSVLIDHFYIRIGIFIVIFRLNEMNNGSVANPGTIDQPQTDVDLLEESILYNYIFKHNYCCSLNFTHSAPSFAFIPF